MPPVLALTPLHPPEVLLQIMEYGNPKPLVTATAQSTNNTSPSATETMSKQVHRCFPRRRLTRGTANSYSSLDKPKSRLESLPAEVRLSIWKAALPTKKELEVEACEDLTDHKRGWCYHNKDEAETATALAKLTSAFEPHSLVLVTHEIRNEVLALIDRRRVFVLANSCCVSSFLRRCSRERKALIERICIKWDIHTSTEAQIYSWRYSSGYLDELITRVLTRRFHQVEPVTHRLTELEANGHFAAIHEVRVGKPIEEHSEDESGSEESE